MTKAATKRALAPAAIRTPFARYSHGIEVPPGMRLVLCSGQLGIAADERVPAGCRRAGGALLREHRGDPGRSRA